MSRRSVRNSMFIGRFPRANQPIGELLSLLLLFALVAVVIVYCRYIVEIYIHYYGEMCTINNSCRNRMDCSELKRYLPKKQSHEDEKQEEGNWLVGDDENFSTVFPNTNQIQNQFIWMKNNTQKQKRSIEAKHNCAIIKMDLNSPNIHGKHQYFNKAEHNFITSINYCQLIFAITTFIGTVLATHSKTIGCWKHPTKSPWLRLCRMIYKWRAFALVVIEIF